MILLRPRSGTFSILKILKEDASTALKENYL